MGHEQNNHSHDGSHGHGHSHGAEGVSDAGLLWAVACNVALSVFEVIAGVISGSVALVADALHNFNDCAALFIAYLARRISRRGANREYTFSYRRAELIGAMINLTALIIVGLFLVYEAVRRLFEPQTLMGGWMMAAAGVALVVDVATAWLLWAMSRGSLNVRAAFVHNLTDALASVAVLVGGAAVYFLDWNWIDPVLTIGISGYILYISAKMMRQTVRILMEAVPEGLDLEELRVAVESQPHVVELHHLHVWEIDEHHRALEAHIVIPDDATPRIADVKHRIKHLLEEKFEITHSMLEVERASERCADGQEQLVPEHD